jgi:hypothetical protein
MVVLDHLYKPETTVAAGTYNRSVLLLPPARTARQFIVQFVEPCPFRPFRRHEYGQKTNHT